MRYLLDKALDNLSPSDDWEFKRLELFVKEVYQPSLMVLLEGRRQEMRAEAYEEYCRSILKYLLNEELKGQTA